MKDNKKSVGQSLQKGQTHAINSDNLLERIEYLFAPNSLPMVSMEQKNRWLLQLGQLVLPIVEGFKLEDEQGDLVCPLPRASQLLLQLEKHYQHIDGTLKGEALSLYAGVTPYTHKHFLQLSLNTLFVQLTKSGEMTEEARAAIAAGYGILAIGIADCYIPAYRQLNCALKLLEAVHQDNSFFVDPASFEDLINGFVQEAESIQNKHTE